MPGTTARVLRDAIRETLGHGQLKCANVSNFFYTVHEAKEMLLILIVKEILTIKMEFEGFQYYLFDQYITFWPKSCNVIVKNVVVVHFQVPCRRPPLLCLLCFS